MKTWKNSLYLSLAAFVMLAIAFLLPDSYSIFTWEKNEASAGILFPFMFLIWSMSLLAFAMNNVFADKHYINYNFKMPALLKYLPSLLGIPSFISFVWFIYTWIKGNPKL